MPGDFLSPGEVDALLKGVTGEKPSPADRVSEMVNAFNNISEDDWAAAMAEQAMEEHPDACKPTMTKSQYQFWLRGMIEESDRKVTEYSAAKAAYELALARSFNME